MRDRDVAKRKAIKSNDPHEWTVYKRLRYKINGEVNLLRHPLFRQGERTDVNNYRSISVLNIYVSLIFSRTFVLRPTCMNEICICCFVLWQDILLFEKCYSEV